MLHRYFFIPAVAYNKKIDRKKGNQKSNRHSAHMVMFLLSHAREEDEKKKKKIIILAYTLTHSFAKKGTTIAGCVCAYQ